MEIVGNPDITKQMIMIRKRELNGERKQCASSLRERTKERERMEKEAIETDAIQYKIDQLERKIDEIDAELKYYSAQYQPVRLFDSVINYKLLKQILQKTKKLSVTFEKGDNETVILSWDVISSKGQYRLNNLAAYYKNIIYIPELVIQE